MLLISEEQFSIQKIEIVEDYVPGLPLILADSRQLQQAFLNIILNAAQAMPDGGRFKVSTRLEKGFVRIEFADTGCGIKKEHTRQIFDPFFTTREGRSGLGLSITYSIIKAHGGTIDVKSEPGKGALFIIKLPVKM